jgi:hypothetical protein
MPTKTRNTFPIKYVTEIEIQKTCIEDNIHLFSQHTFSWAVGFATDTMSRRL